MTGDLAVWLRGVLDADEQAAQRVLDDKPYFQQIAWGWFDPDFGEFHPSTEPTDPGYGMPTPAFVLADIAAKKDAVALHCAVESNYADYPVCVECSHLDHEEEPHPCTTLRLLARPYAGRPGWSDEWKVT